jgi:hypothetical protein
VRVRVIEVAMTATEILEIETEKVASLVGAGVISSNEAREMLGMAKLEDPAMINILTTTGNGIYVPSGTYIGDAPVNGYTAIPSGYTVIPNATIPNSGMWPHRELERMLEDADLDAFRELQVPVESPKEPPPVERDFEVLPLDIKRRIVLE